LQIIRPRQYTTIEITAVFVNAFGYDERKILTDFSKILVKVDRATLLQVAKSRGTYA